MTTPPSPGVPATLEAVAAAAGVSKSTVSRVVNGSSQVSPEVADAVQAAIERLNYVPNRAARSLANRQTMSIALVVPEDITRFFSDLYLSAVVEGIARGLDESDYVLNLQLSNPSRPTRKTLRYLIGGNVDGALVVSHHSGDHFLESLGASIPVVFGGRPYGVEGSTSYFVDVDNASGAQKGTQHLIDIGRRRIAILAGPPDMPAGVDRTQGWLRALEASGLEHHRVRHGDFSLASGVAAMRELLDAYPDLDAVFVASDTMAAGALSVLRERGLRVPDDVAVVGFDDSPAATDGDVKLSTVRQPSVEMGIKMAEMMLGILRGEPVERVSIMPTTLILRDSA